MIGRRGFLATIAAFIAAPFAANLPLPRAAATPATFRIPDLRATHNRVAFIKARDGSSDPFKCRHGAFTAGHMPVGSMLHFSVDWDFRAPAGWLPCDGRRLNVADYPDLFACIGTVYGP